jgi:hypothetical protein
VAAGPLRLPPAVTAARSTAVTVSGGETLYVEVGGAGSMEVERWRHRRQLRWGGFDAVEAARPICGQLGIARLAAGGGREWWWQRRWGHRWCRWASRIDCWVTVASVVGVLAVVLIAWLHRSERAVRRHHRADRGAPGEIAT